MRSRCDTRPNNGMHPTRSVAGAPSLVGDAERWPYKVNITDWIKTYLPKWVALPLTLLLLILIGMLFVDFHQILPSETAKLLNPSQILKIAAISFLLFLAISFCYILLYRAFTKKPNIKNYDLINPPGFLKHKRTGKYYCQRCFVKDHNVSELSLVPPGNKLLCRCCNDSYDISTKIIPASYFSKAWDEFVKEIVLKNKDGQQVNEGDG